MMRRIGIHGAGFVPISSMGACPSGVVAVTPWYLSGGIAAANCIAAYTPKGAANLAASYNNDAAPGNGLPDGTYDAAPGTAPTWGAVNGWQFTAALNQYLTTGGLIPGAGTWSMFVRYSNITNAAAGPAIVGSYNVGACLIAVNATEVQTYNGDTFPAGQCINAPTLLGGVYGFTAKQPYRDGVIEPVVIPGVNSANIEIWIGCFNFGGTPLSFMDGNIQALTLYNVGITGPQAVALSVAMAAL